MNRWASSISTVAIAVAGLFSSVNSPVVAAPACTPGAPLEGSAITGTTPPAAIQTRARTTANSFSNPDVTLTRFNTSGSGATAVYEVRGRQSSASSTATPGFLCQLETDVFFNGAIEEVEEELATVAQLPAVVQNTLNANLPRASFQPYFIELSRRYTNGTQTAIVYEIEGVCTATISNRCTASQDIEIQINSNGSLRNIEIPGR